VGLPLSPTSCQHCVRGEPKSCRKWIWAGIGYNLGITLVLTYFVGLALTYLSPPKARPTTPADEVAMRNKVHQEAVMRSRTMRRLKVMLVTVNPEIWRTAACIPMARA
jgi:hypothetical protein